MLETLSIKRLQCFVKTISISFECGASIAKPSYDPRIALYTLVNHHTLHLAYFKVLNLSALHVVRYLLAVT